jgi:Acetoacetate decarboxylase (ADC)
LVPGDDSAVEPGPWHYGADYVTVYFKGQRDRLRPLVPGPFEVGDGTCMAYVCEIISVAEGGRDSLLKTPDRASYMEAALGVGCSYEGRRGVYFPVMWVNTEWALLRGILNGYPKRLADRIGMTRTHPLNPGMAPTAPGTKKVGYAVKGPERVLSVGVEVKKKGEPSDLRSFGATFGARMLPRTHPSQGEVGEAVEVVKSNSRVSDVWLGDGVFSTDLDVGDPAPLGGAVYSSGFTIHGAKSLAKI